MALCSRESSVIFSSVTLYFMSGFFPIMPSPEQGRSHNTISNASLNSSLYIEASFTLISISEKPHLPAASRIREHLASEISHEVILYPISAKCRLFPPGAAQRSRTFPFLHLQQESAIKPASAELKSCTTTVPFLNSSIPSGVPAPLSVKQQSRYLFFLITVSVSLNAASNLSYINDGSDFVLFVL